MSPLPGVHNLYKHQSSIPLPPFLTKKRLRKNSATSFYNFFLSLEWFSRHLWHIAHHLSSHTRIRHLFHYFTHIRELLHQFVYLIKARSRSFRNSVSSLRIDCIRILTFKWSHGINNGFNRFECIIIDLNILDRFTYSRNHSHQILHVTHFLDLLDLGFEVVEIKFIFTDFLLKFRCLFLVKLLLSTLYQGNHITHT